jgi:hypothetical protein
MSNTADVDADAVAEFTEWAVGPYQYSLMTSSYSDIYPDYAKQVDETGHGADIANMQRWFAAGLDATYALDLMTSVWCEGSRYFLDDERFVVYMLDLIYSYKPDTSDVATKLLQVVHKGIGKPDYEDTVGSDYHVRGFLIDNLAAHGFTLVSPVKWANVVATYWEDVTIPEINADFDGCCHRYLKDCSTYLQSL